MASMDISTHLNFTFIYVHIFMYEYIQFMSRYKLGDFWRLTKFGRDEKIFTAVKFWAFKKNVFKACDQIKLIKNTIFSDRLWPATIATPSPNQFQIPTCQNNRRFTDTWRPISVASFAGTVASVDGIPGPLVRSRAHRSILGLVGGPLCAQVLLTLLNCRWEFINPFLNLATCSICRCHRCGRLCWANSIVTLSPATSNAFPWTKSLCIKTMRIFNMTWVWHHHQKFQIVSINWFSIFLFSQIFATKLWFDCRNRPIWATTRMYEKYVCHSLRSTIRSLGPKWHRCQPMMMTCRTETTFRNGIIIICEAYVCGRIERAPQMHHSSVVQNEKADVRRRPLDGRVNDETISSYMISGRLTLLSEAQIKFR